MSKLSKLQYSIWKLADSSTWSQFKAFCKIWNQESLLQNDAKRSTSTCSVVGLCHVDHPLNFPFDPVSCSRNTIPLVAFFDTAGVTILSYILTESHPKKGPIAWADRCQDFDMLTQVDHVDWVKVKIVSTYNMLLPHGTSSTNSSFFRIDFNKNCPEYRKVPQALDPALINWAGSQGRLLPTSNGGLERIKRLNSPNSNAVPFLFLAGKHQGFLFTEDG